MSAVRALASCAQADVLQFSRMSDRQLGLWDTSSLTNLNMESIDTSA